MVDAQERGKRHEDRKQKLREWGTWEDTSVADKMKQLEPGTYEVTPGVFPHVTRKA